MGTLLDPVDPKVLRQAIAGVLRLTPSEYRVLRAVLAGRDMVMAADTLGISKRTVEAHIHNISAKCGCTVLMLRRLAHELEAEPDVVAYLRALPPINPALQHGGKRSAAARAGLVADEPGDLAQPRD